MVKYKGRGRGQKRKERGRKKGERGGEGVACNVQGYTMLHILI